MAKNGVVRRDNDTSNTRVPGWHVKCTQAGGKGCENAADLASKLQTKQEEEEEERKVEEKERG
jgi:hypothetical protein